VQSKKIASLGLRLKNQCCYHGLSLNVAMDLSPFLAIDPCGYAGLSMTQTKDLGIEATFSEISEQLLAMLEDKLHSCLTQ
jgi:lipoyl(octanoyl) transferase